MIGNDNEVTRRNSLNLIAKNLRHISKCLPTLDEVSNNLTTSNYVTGCEILVLNKDGNIHDPSLTKVPELEKFLENESRDLRKNRANYLLQSIIYKNM